MWGGKPPENGGLIDDDPVDDEARERFVRVVGLPPAGFGPGSDGVGVRPPGAAVFESLGPLPAERPPVERPPVVADPPAPGLGLPGRGLPDSGLPDSGLPGPGGTGVSVGARRRGAGRAGPLAAFDPGRRGVRALALVAVVVIAVVGFLTWRARPTTQPLAVRASPASAEPGASGVSGGVVVAVSGKVRRPGLVRLPAGSRVADAIEAAGGVLPDTDLAYLNLARRLVDGELVLVGVASPAAGEGATGAGPSPAAGKVNLNTAGLSELQTLPGVGPVLAQRIIDYRARHGGFRSPNELRQVEGIGSTRFDRLRELVTV